MKKVDIYEILLKVFGLYFLFSILMKIEVFFITIWSALQFETFNNDPSEGLFQNIKWLPTILIIILYFGLLFFLFYMLFYKTDTIIKRIAKPADYETMTISFINQKFTYKLISIVFGLLMIGNSIPDLIIAINEKIYYVQNNFDYSNFSNVGITSNAIKTIIGLVLIIGAELFASLLSKKSIQKEEEQTPI